MKNPDPQRLDYLDGTFHYVFPDDIPLIIYNKVTWYVQQARMEIDNILKFAKINPTHIDSLYKEVDTLVFDVTAPYFSAIAALVNIPNVENLTSTSRYEFFVQRLVLDEGHIQQKPSQLDILLGAGVEDEQVEKSDKEIPTSGDIVCDIEVSLRLTFKHNATSVIRSKGLVYCLMLLSQASQQLKMAQDEAEEKYGDNKSTEKLTPVSEGGEINMESRPLNPIFASEKKAILAGVNIPLPEFE
jgi:hypothetical protein